MVPEPRIDSLEEYKERYAENFKAENYDPKAWAKLAKDAGMKYAVLTTRHHDGFALWPTKTSEFHAGNIGPKRDLVAPYVEAFREAGLKVGFYFSPASWYYPDYPGSHFRDWPNEGDWKNSAFLGGSLTWGAQATDPLKTSYRAIVARNLSERYPEADFNFVDAAIGGTGSQLGAFRLQRDVLAYEPDLAFLDFTVNDHASKVPEDDRPSSYESLIRRMVQADVPVVQVTTD